LLSSYASGERVRMPGLSVLMDVTGSPPLRSDRFLPPSGFPRGFPPRKLFITEIFPQPREILPGGQEAGGGRLGFLTGSLGFHTKLTPPAFPPDGIEVGATNHYTSCYDNYFSSSESLGTLPRAVLNVQ
jgi:hypothetical protein